MSFLPPVRAPRLNHDDPTSFSSNLMGNTSAPGAPSSGWKRGKPAKSDGSPWIKSWKKVLRGNDEQRCVALICANFDGVRADRGPPSIRLKALRLAGNIHRRNRYVFADAKFSGFPNRCIHIFLR